MRRLALCLTLAVLLAVPALAQQGSTAGPGTRGQAGDPSHPSVTPARLLSSRPRARVRSSGPYIPESLYVPLIWDSYVCGTWSREPSQGAQGSPLEVVQPQPRIEEDPGERVPALPRIGEG